MTDFATKYSKVFVETAKVFESQLLPSLQDTIPNIAAVKVTALEKGSTIVHFQIVLDETSPVLKNTDSMIKQALTGNSNMSKLSFSVDKNYEIAIASNAINFYFSKINI